MNTFSRIMAMTVFGFCTATTFAAEPATIKLWPNTPPGDEKVSLPAEADQTKPTDNLIAGRKIIKLGNVTSPLLVIYPAPKETATGAAVVVCPGGGHNILAWDLEGTEVAEWLNKLGVTAFVLKYRVPARNKDNRSEAAVQDAQRAMSIVRSRASEWQLDPARIGILGFSAGGETAALAGLFTERKYTDVDDADKTSSRPDFMLLIYPAYLVEKDNSKLKDYVKVARESPPTFFVHASDDGVTPLSSVLLYAELKRAGVKNCELHVFASGGHGYGLRETEQPVTRWPDLAAKWFTKSGFLAAKK